MSKRSYVRPLSLSKITSGKGKGRYLTSNRWRLVFSDDFETWDSSRYFVYPNTWNDTSGNGTYDPTAISASNGILRAHLYTDGQSVRHAVAFCPLPDGRLSDRGDLLSMAVEFRIRADSMAGWKGVPLLWPISGHSWPTWGEINWPEGAYDARPSAFMHRQDGVDGSDQDYYQSPVGTTWQDWHVYRTEWIAGTSCAFYIDGVLVGRSTSRVPSGAMHLVMQFETNTNPLTPPDAGVSGYVEIDYLRVYVPS